MVILGLHHQEIRVQTLLLLVLQKYFLLQKQKLCHMENDGTLHLKHPGTDIKIQAGYKLGMMTVCHYQRNMTLQTPKTLAGLASGRLAMMMDTVNYGMP